MKRGQNINQLFIITLGTIGTVLIGLGAMKYTTVYEDRNGYLIIFIGFLLTMYYIEFLEKRAGISKKHRWTRIGVTILLFSLGSFVLYF